MTTNGEQYMYEVHYIREIPFVLIVHNDVFIAHNWWFIYNGHKIDGQLQPAMAAVMR